MSESIYVEYGDRLYELRMVNKPVDSDGRRCRIHIVPDEQVIEIGPTVTPFECANTLAETLGMEPTDVIWRMVPVRGRVNQPLAL